MRQFLSIAWFAVLLLSGCEWMEQEASAGSSEPSALMQVVMPGWKRESPASIRNIALPAEKGQPPEVDSYTLAPGPVMKLAADRVVLIVVSVPAYDTGIPRGGHATPALLSAYWFEKRDDRWFKTAEQEAFAQEGFFGEPGELKQIDLGGGKTALAVENGSCWQGSCGRWLGLYAIGEQRVDRVFSDLISSDSEDATASCGEVMKQEIGGQERVPLEAYSRHMGCYRIAGQWKITPAPSGPGRLVIEFSGKQSSGKVVPVQPTPAAKATSEGEEDDDPTEEYLVTVREVRQKQVYRYQTGKYVLVSGTNPNPGL